MTMSRKPGSMTRRLVIALTSVMALFWLSASGLGILVMQDELSEIFDSSLQETAERLLPLVVDDLNEREASAVPRGLDAKTASGEEYLRYQVRDATGKVILHSHDSAAKAFDSPLVVGFSDTPTQRIYTAASADGSLYVQVADPLEHRSEAIIEGGLALLLPLLVLIPASIFAILLVVRRMLTPIQSLRASIASKDGGNMVPIDQTSLPQELHPIAHSVNLLLDRLRSALEAEREFTANSAHELRTPIAGALAQTQRLAAELPDSFTARVGQVERSLGHLSRLAEKLLQLSRAEAGIGVTDLPADLRQVLAIVIEDMERSPIGAGRIRWQAGEDSGLQRTVNADAFAIIIRNLLENALIHSPAGSPVEIRSERGGGISIRNHGPVVERQLLDTITGRFVRGSTNIPGSGLGLSIVKRLVEQMNGRIEFASPASGCVDGFEVRLFL
jgi:two-component system OmpR family sensor kinase